MQGTDFLREGEKLSLNLEELGVKPLSRVSCGGSGICFRCPLDASLGMCSRLVPLGEAPWEIQDTLERLRLSAGLGVPCNTPKKLEEGY